MNFYMKSLLTIILFIFSFYPMYSNILETSPVIAHIDFNNLNVGAFSFIEQDHFILSSKDGEDRILGKGGRISSQCLYLMGGEDHVVELELIDKRTSIGFISFKGHRLSPELPFSFTVEAFIDDKWTEIYKGDTIFKIGWFSDNISMPVFKNNVNKIRFRCTSPNIGGLLLDDLVLLDKTPMQIKEVNGYHLSLPILIDKEQNPVQKLVILASGEFNAELLEEVKINNTGTTKVNDIESIQIYYTGSNPDFSTDDKFGEIFNPGQSISIQGKQTLHHGANYFWICYTVATSLDIRSYIHSQIEKVSISDKDYPYNFIDSNMPHRLGFALRDHNDEGVHTYRIPGLVTTNKGTLIAVYDIRRNGSVDLQADIDVGMSRSTNGGQSWEPMRVIMDMDKWGGLPEDENGIGDPSILVDRTTNTVWVAGIWAHGHKDMRNWLESKPGMDPEVTSQLMLVKSEDDGKTWSEAINITSAIKKEEWPLLLQGPGKGITMSDGTLVFPAQFKDKDHMPHSTIIWSKDHGSTWNIGIGAKSNTTESQVIELNDGSLMLNMRDNRNRQDTSATNGRSVSVSDDLGNTWTEHNTSGGVLIEPVCMASIIKEEFSINGSRKSLVLFSNPASKDDRKNITIKFSFDDGNTWPEEYSTLLDEEVGRGYSCMTKIDDQHIGILYESSLADLVFQVINIEEILNQFEE